MCASIFIIFKQKPKKKQKNTAIFVEKGDQSYSNNNTKKKNSLTHTQAILSAYKRVRLEHVHLKVQIESSFWLHKMPKNGKIRYTKWNFHTDFIITGRDFVQSLCY